MELECVCVCECVPTWAAVTRKRVCWSHAGVKGEGGGLYVSMRVRVKGALDLVCCWETSRVH